MPTPSNEEEFLTRREAEILMNSAKELNSQYVSAHDSVHIALKNSVEVALAAVASERKIHAEAHEREHIAHLEVHRLNNLAIEKAEGAADKRFDAANGYRQIFEARMSETASQHSIDALQKEYDRRIQSLESADLKSESLKRGQGSIIAYITGAVAFFATILTIIIVLANVFTSGRP